MIFIPIPLPRKVIHKLHTVPICNFKDVLQTGLGMGMGMNGTAHSPARRCLFAATCVSLLENIGSGAKQPDMPDVGHATPRHINIRFVERGIRCLKRKSLILKGNPLCLGGYILRKGSKRRKICILCVLVRCTRPVWLMANSVEWRSGPLRVPVLVSFPSPGPTDKIGTTDPKPRKFSTLVFLIYFSSSCICLS